MATQTPKDVLKFAKDNKVEAVDLKFCDLLGTWQHVTLPIGSFDESAFDEGLGFDGSSIRGWQGISESDMLLMPDAASAILDPFTEAPTLSLICEIADPITKQPYAKDPRRIARKAEEYLRSTGIADTAFMGPECEFFVLDSVSYELADHRSHYAIDSAEGHWNSGEPGLGYTVREKEGYFPPAPHDTLHDLRTRMVLTLERLGIDLDLAALDEGIVDIQAAVGGDISGLAHHDDVVEAVPALRKQCREDGLRGTSGVDYQPASGPDGTIECGEKRTYAGSVEIGEAVAETEGSIKLCLPGQVTHFAVVPFDLDSACRRLCFCFLDELADVDQRSRLALGHANGGAGIEKCIIQDAGPGNFAQKAGQ